VAGVTAAVTDKGTQERSRSAAGLPRIPFRLVKLIVFLVSLVPFVYLLTALLTGSLGANPIEALTDETGEWAIRFIMLSLSLTPLRGLLKNAWPVRLRRMLGLYAFFYTALHFGVYFGLDQQLDLVAVWEDLSERPYILAGFTAFVIFLPLAATSTRGMVKRLGRRWSSLHRWVYIAATAAVVHYVWLARGDLIEPFVYLGILFVLLSYRFVKLLKA